MRHIDAYLDSGVLEKSVFDLVMLVLRPALPSDVSVAYSFDSDFKKLFDTKVKELPDGGRRIYPQRVQQKHWVLWVLRKTNSVYTLERHLHEKHDPKALVSFTKKLEHTFNLREISDTTWTSSGSTDAQIFLVLLQCIYGQTDVEHMHARTFQAKLAATLTSIKEHCIAKNVADVDEACDAEGLADLIGIFESVVDVSTSIKRSAHRNTQLLPKRKRNGNTGTEQNETT